MAWQVLKDDRHTDGWGGMGAISYRTISRYARDNGLSGTGFTTFVKLIGEMDDEYLIWSAEQRAAAKKETPT